MGGGLMQLVAYGAQDVYLTGNPQITFFKVVYRRHTNFSMEAIQQTWNGSSLDNGRCTATISRNGDLVHRMYIELKGDSDTNGPDNATSKCLTSVEVEIGGQKIDKHSGLFMETYAELTQPNSAGLTGDSKDPNGTLFQNMSGMGGVTWADTTGEKTFYVPLQFWFCRNPGLALPLIALQYHEVKIILEHQYKSFFNISMSKNELWCDYIYLDTDERRRFAQVSHEYLIEQVQYQSDSGPNNAAKKFTLNFNHPVKELVWCAAASATPTEFLALHAIGTAATNQSSGSGLLKLNGHDRFSARDMQYFTRVQPHQHHTNVPPCGRIGVYSFALKPEEHQPSGTCNFSRIDNAELTLTPSTDLSSANVTVFAINYNVLRVMSGMGGLAYSN